MRALILIALAARAPAASALARDAASGEPALAQRVACRPTGKDGKKSKDGKKGKPAGLACAEATFGHYGKNPRARVPGTKMAYAGVEDVTRTQDPIACLKPFDASGARAAGSTDLPRLAAR